MSNLVEKQMERGARKIVVVIIVIVLLLCAAAIGVSIGVSLLVFPPVDPVQRQDTFETVLLSTPSGAIEYARTNDNGAN